MLKFKSISVKRHLLSLKTTFLFLIIFIAIYSLSNDFIPVKFLIFGLLPYVVPVVLIHLEYWFYNKDMQVILLEEGLLIQYKKNNIIIENNDIKNVILNAAGGVFLKSDWEMFPFQQYHYLEIITKNGKHILTSLLFNRNIEFELKEFIKLNADKYVRKKRFIASELFKI